MIKCRNMQKAAPPAWQPWQSCQRAAALIKQYDDGLIENKLREREREGRGSQRKLHKFTGRVKQSYHSIYRYHLPFTIENTSLPKHLISLTHTHTGNIKQATRANRSNRAAARQRERARQRSSGRSSTHKSKQNHMP